MSVAAIALAVVAGPALAQDYSSSAEANLQAIREILATPDADIDLAKSEVTIERMIDPSIDASRTLAKLDAMAVQLKTMVPVAASSRLTLDALRYHLYKPSPWNGNLPYSYDLDDPFGASIRNKLLTTYIATHKGNCVSMPLLFIILGQKLGIDVTAALAPNHVFVKYRDSDGESYNLETTSGAGFTREVWMRQQFSMTDEALKSGIYMRPLTKKETVAVMAGTLLQFYSQQGMPQQQIALAKLARRYAPRDVSLLLEERQGYVALARQEFSTRHRSPSDIPPEEKMRFAELEGNINSLYEQAYALGWRPEDSASEDSYRQTISRAKSGH